MNKFVSISLFLCFFFASNSISQSFTPICIEYVGCFADQPQNTSSAWQRDLDVEYFPNLPTSTIEISAQLCKNLSKYFGAQPTEVNCGNSYGRYGPGSCVQPCGGNDQEFCGAASINSVFKYCGSRDTFGKRITSWQLQSEHRTFGSCDWHSKVNSTILFEISKRTVVDDYNFGTFKDRNWSEYRFRIGGNNSLVNVTVFEKGFYVDFNGGTSLSLFYPHQIHWSEFGCLSCDYGWSVISERNETTIFATPSFSVNCNEKPFPKPRPSPIPANSCSYQIDLRPFKNVDSTLNSAKNMSGNLLLSGILFRIDSNVTAIGAWGHKNVVEIGPFNITNVTSFHTLLSTGYGIPGPKVYASISAVFENEISIDFPLLGNYNVRSWHGPNTTIWTNQITSPDVSQIAYAWNNTGPDTGNMDVEHWYIPKEFQNLTLKKFVFQDWSPFNSENAITETVSITLLYGLTVCVAVPNSPTPSISPITFTPIPTPPNLWLSPSPIPKFIEKCVQFFGCFEETIAQYQKDMNASTTTDQHLTVAIGSQFCEGYKFFGLQNGTQVYCDNQFGRFGGSVCFESCGGNSQEMCGAKIGVEITANSVWGFCPVSLIDTTPLGKWNLNWNSSSGSLGSCNWHSLDGTSILMQILFRTNETLNINTYRDSNWDLNYVRLGLNSNTNDSNIDVSVFESGLYIEFWGRSENLSVFYPHRIDWDLFGCVVCDESWEYLSGNQTFFGVPAFSANCSQTQANKNEISMQSERKKELNNKVCKTISINGNSSFDDFGIPGFDIAGEQNWAGLEFFIYPNNSLWISDSTLTWPNFLAIPIFLNGVTEIHTVISTANGIPGPLAFADFEILGSIQNFTFPILGDFNIRTFQSAGETIYTNQITSPNVTPSVYYFKSSDPTINPVILDVQHWFLPQEMLNQSIYLLNLRDWGPNSPSNRRQYWQSLFLFALTVCGNELGPAPTSQPTPEPTPIPTPQPTPEITSERTSPVPNSNHSGLDKDLIVVISCLCVAICLCFMTAVGCVVWAYKLKKRNNEFKVLQSKIGEEGLMKNQVKQSEINQQASDNENTNSSGNEKNQVVTSDLKRQNFIPTKEDFEELKKVYDQTKAVLRTELEDQKLKLKVLEQEMDFEKKFSIETVDKMRQISEQKEEQNGERTLDSMEDERDLLKRELLSIQTRNELLRNSMDNDKEEELSEN